MARWKTILDSAASISMIGASTAILWITIGRPAVPQAPASAQAAGELVESTTWRLPASGTLGSTPPGAKVVLIEFSDFECPFCRRYSRETFPNVKRAFIDSGKIAYVFRNYPLDAIHPKARNLAVSAMCAGEQGRFWEVHQLLFGASEHLQPSAADLTKRLSLDQTLYTECLGTAHAKLQEEVVESRELGISSTPTFLLGELTGDRTVLVRRRITGAQPFETFKKLIEEALAKSTG